MTPLAKDIWDFLPSSPSLDEFKRGTVAWIIQRYILEMDGSDERRGVRPMGASQRYTLAMMQRAEIGAVLASELRRSHVIDHAKARIAAGVLPATVMQDITYLSGALKYASSAWSDCEDVSDAAVAAAKPFMTKHGLIGKSTPRERRPQPEEIERLIAFFNTPKAHGFDRRLPMELMTRWQLASSRRIGESCRLLWSDWNREDKTILVRKMKDPRNRDKNKLVALPDEAQAMLLDLWDKRDPSEPRIFPVNAKSVGAAYTRAKKELGIVNLHLHDSRRDCVTRLIQEQGFSPAEATCFSGHETPAVLERVYLKMDPAKVKDGPLARRMQAQTQ